MARILVFGDSIAYGAWDIEGGWVQRLRKYLDYKNLNEDSYYLVYNLGVSGDTSEDLLRRFEFETEQRIKENDETIIIFAIGINDSQFIIDKNDNRVPIDKFEGNIRNLIQLAKNYSSKIIFVGLTPVDESKTIPILWNPNKMYKNKFIQKYNDVLKEICKKNNVYFVNVLENFMKLDYKDLLEDGVHPNSKGHELLFKMVKEFLERENII